MVMAKEVQKRLTKRFKVLKTKEKSKEKMSMKRKEKKMNKGI